MEKNVCEVIEKKSDFDPSMWQCCECGEWWWQNDEPLFCPSCGRRIVEWTEVKNQKNYTLLY